MGERAGPQDQIAADAAPQRYAGFISYSHQDKDFALWLHRRLEAYRLPPHAAARADASRLVGRRLRPFFRDTDELTAGHDLNEAVSRAIGRSDFLIVVCSPAAAASPWVAREIEAFRAAHDRAHVLAALVEGEPSEAFPPALTAEGLEPIAADFRGDGATKRLGLLKLVAALAATPLDELVQRDAQRRLRSTLVGLAAAAGIAAVVAGMGVAAWTSHLTAQAERARSGKLGDFVSTDLRASLEAAGRHDLLAQVDQAALNAYRTGGAGHLTPEQLEQEAKLLQGAGKDAEKKGDLKGAQADCEAALKITAALIAEKPDDPKRIFAHAQSEYWIGFIDWRLGNIAGARAGYEAYARLAQRLVKIDPDNDSWRMETVYAAQNLGSLALRQSGDPATAERYYRTAIGELDALAARGRGGEEIQSTRATALAWLADSQRLSGRPRDALQTRETQRSLLQSLLAKNPRSVEIKRQLLANELAIARIDADMGDRGKSLTLLRAGRAKALSLAAADPDNKDYPKQARMFELFEARLWLSPAAGGAPTSKLDKLIGDCTPKGAGSDNLEISDFCYVLKARLLSQQGDVAGADAALAPVRKHQTEKRDVLTPRWGLNLAAEAQPIQIASRGK